MSLAPNYNKQLTICVDTPIKYFLTICPVFPLLLSFIASPNTSPERLLPRQVVGKRREQPQVQGAGERGSETVQVVRRASAAERRHSRWGAQQFSSNSGRSELHDPTRPLQPPPRRPADQGPGGRPHDAPRGDRDAALHARGHAGGAEDRLSRPGRRGGGEDRPRQHLPPLPPAGDGGGGAARGAPRVHGVEAARS